MASLVKGMTSRHPGNPGRLYSIVVDAATRMTTDSGTRTSPRCCGARAACEAYRAVRCISPGSCPYPLDPGGRGNLPAAAWRECCSARSHAHGAAAHGRVRPGKGAARAPRAGLPRRPRPRGGHCPRLHIGPAPRSPHLGRASRLNQPYGGISGNAREVRPGAFAGGDAQSELSGPGTLSERAGKATRGARSHRRPAGARMPRSRPAAARTRHLEPQHQRGGVD